MYVGNVILGLGVVVVVVRIVVLLVTGAWVGGNAVPDMDEEIEERGLGTVRLEQASTCHGCARQPISTRATSPCCTLIVECITICSFLA